MSLSLSEVSRSVPRLFFNQINNSGGTLMQTNWTSIVKELGFSPDFAIVRSVSYNTDSTGDKTIYSILCDLSNNDEIATFVGSNTYTGSPQTLIKLGGSPIQSINFSITGHSTDGTNTKNPASSTLVNTDYSSVSILVDFVKLKK